MGKLLAVILSVLSVAGCGNTADVSTSVVSSQPVESVSESTSSEETADISTDTSDGKTLVVYFSNTGNTKRTAEIIADYTGADIFEIEAKEPYTAEDLNYNDSSSRVSKENSDSSARPEIKENIQDLDQYDTIFVGYPTWWGQAPKIMYTLMETNDFSGKTIIPFCTSASSGIGTSAENLSKSAPDSVWKDGQRFSGSSSEDDIKSWVDSVYDKTE